MSQRASIPAGLRLGILGGGQLARMMASEGHRLGLQVHIFSGSIQDPAAQVTSHWTRGNIHDSKALASFVERMDYVTFESEFVPTEELAKFEKKSPGKVFPKPSVMKRLQNRLSQKQTFIEYKIPTAPFIEVQKAADLDLAAKNLGDALVLKTNFGGYDGYGTFFAQSKSDLFKLAEQVSNSTDKFIAEKRILFKKELAAMLVRTSTGQFFSLPLVQTQQTQGRCDWVLGPVQHKSWKSLEKKLLQMLKALDYVGVLGVEMFDTGSELWVNELAPRVHNSGHYSQEALSESQFLLHVKAGLGFQLQKPQLLSPQFVMTNLLGRSEKPVETPDKLTGHLHWYGKGDNRPGRKMGHVTYLGKNSAGLLKLALRERKGFTL